MVNASVQQEIRNPINSIHCQSVVINMLKRMIDDLIKYASTNKMSFEHIKEKLLAIKRHISEAMGINVSSEKLVSFLIEDFMDMASLRTGKF